MQLARTYADALFADRAAIRPIVRDVMLVVGGSLLVALAAQVSIPVQPVPMTLQTLAVVLVGAALGARRGALALVLYLLEGAAGLPVFAPPHLGALKLVGPTAGYLFAFPLAAGLVGALIEHGWDRRRRTAMGAILFGDLLILGLGVAWLSTSLGLRAALVAGFYPFILLGALKLMLAAALLPAARRWVDSTGRA